MNRVQKEILSVYKEISRVCEKNGIKYYVTGGTALGAVRHSGFIPWDDDIDVGIPIDDFDNFKRACEKDMREPYEFIELMFTGGKVHNKNTAFIESQCFDSKEHGYGVFVDIFPIIGIPNDPIAREDFLLDMKKFHYKAFVHDRYPEVSDYSRDEIKKWRDRILYGNVIHDSEKVVEFSLGFFFQRDAEGLKGTRKLKFEDTEVPVSAVVEKDLEAQYGKDYMTPPPKEKRITHDKYSLVDCDTSYLDYFKRYEKIDRDLLSLLHAKHNLEGIFYDDLYDFLLKYEESQREIVRLQEALKNEQTAFSKRLVRYARRKLKRS